MKTERCLLKVFIEVAEQTVRRLLGIRPELRRVEVKSIVLLLRKSVHHAH